MAIRRSARPRARQVLFLLAFAVPMRFAVGAGSNKRTVGRFSFCGLCCPILIPSRFLFFAAAAAAVTVAAVEASVTLRLCTVPQVLPSRKEPWRSRELFLSRCFANRRAVAFRSTNSGIIILSISRVRRYTGTRRTRTRVLVARVGESAVIYSCRNCPVITKA